MRSINLITLSPTKNEAFNPNQVYIAQDNPIAAMEVVADIYEKAQVLATFPQIIHKYRTEPEGEIRLLIYGHYRIAYLIRGQGRIDIVGVFHGALEIDRYLP